MRSHYKADSRKINQNAFRDQAVPPMKDGESELNFVSNKMSARERAVIVLSEEIVEYLESQNIMFVEKKEFDGLPYPLQAVTESETQSETELGTELGTKLDNQSICVDFVKRDSRSVDLFE